MTSNESNEEIASHACRREARLYHEAANRISEKRINFSEELLKMNSEFNENTVNKIFKVANLR